MAAEKLTYQLTVFVHPNQLKKFESNVQDFREITGVFTIAGQKGTHQLWITVDNTRQFSEIRAQIGQIPGVAAIETIQLLKKIK